MFKLTVFVALMAVACNAAPKPGYLHQAIAYPVATSHSSRIDIHSKPIAVVASPYIHAPILHAPIVKTYAPIVKTIIPAAVSHSSRYDVHSAPLLSYGHGYGGYGGYGGHGLGLGLGYGSYGSYGHGLLGGYGHY